MPIFDPKIHTSHYSTCPDANKFRMRKRPIPKKEPDPQLDLFGEKKI